VETGGRRVVVLTFPPEKSSLTFRVAFPLLVANAISWLNAPGAAPMMTVATGDEFRVAAAGVAGSMTVTRPDGSIVEIAARRGEFVVPVTHPGLWAMSIGEGRLVVAANLTDGTESSLEVADVLAFADASASGQADDVTGLGELWLFAALAAVLLAVVEWTLYHRRLVV
jgi:hypothetical protein